MPQIRDEILLARIASKIKKLRKEKGVTLADFYNDTGIHLARFESSKANISVSTLSKICKYFGITIPEFFKGI